MIIKLGGIYSGELIGDTVPTLEVDGPSAHEDGWGNSRATANHCNTAFPPHPCVDLVFLQSNADSGADGEGSTGGAAGTAKGTGTGMGTGATPKSTPEST